MDVESGVRVLAERPADDFEPTDEEVKNYAEWLGLDPKEDTDLMHLAKEGLKAPLKDGWKPCTNSDNEIFYFNFVTGQTSWTHPADEAYRTMVQEKKKSRGQAGVPVAARCTSVIKCFRFSTLIQRARCFAVLTFPQLRYMRPTVVSVTFP